MAMDFDVASWEADHKTDKLNKSLFGEIHTRDGQVLKSKKRRHDGDEVCNRKKKKKKAKEEETKFPERSTEVKNKKRKAKDVTHTHQAMKNHEDGKKTVKKTDSNHKHAGQSKTPTGKKKKGTAQSQPVHVKSSKHEDGADHKLKVAGTLETSESLSPGKSGKKKRKHKKKKCKNKYAHLAGKPKETGLSPGSGHQGTEGSDKLDLQNVQQKASVVTEKQKVPKSKLKAKAKRAASHHGNDGASADKKINQQKQVGKCKIEGSGDLTKKSHINGDRLGRKSKTDAVKKFEQKKPLPFNIDKLKAVLQDSSSEKESLQSPGPKDRAKPKSSINPKSKNKETLAERPNPPQIRKEASKPQNLRDKMKERLNAARFRYLNEQLYSIPGDEAFEMFSEDRHAFEVYHDGFQTQVSKWPENPVQVMANYINNRSVQEVVADFGCGDAQLAQAVDNKVHSFDLVAVNQHVTACNMANVPLPANSVDIGVFCLALMGTNLTDFLAEANRIIKTGGRLLVAEVVSRFEKVGSFVRKMEKMGFTLLTKDDHNKMFIWFEFQKTTNSPPQHLWPKIELLPCIYKKR